MDLHFAHYLERLPAHGTFELLVFETVNGAMMLFPLGVILERFTTVETFEPFAFIVDRGLVVVPTGQRIEGL